MSYFENMKNEMKKAMKNGDKDRRDALRFAISAIQSIAKKENREVVNKDVIQGINRIIKQSKETIEKLKENGRSFTKELSDIKIWEEMVPKKLSSKELEQLIDKLIDKLIEKYGLNRGKIMGDLSKREDVDMKEANKKFTEKSKS